MASSRLLLVLILLILATAFAANAVKVSFLTISDEDVAADGAESSSSSLEEGSSSAQESLDRESFVDPDTRSDEEIDSGAWYAFPWKIVDEKKDLRYSSGIANLLSSSAGTDVAGMERAAEDIETAAAEGHPHAQSAMAFLHGAGILRPRSKAKSLLYHSFAAAGGNAQSKMALAYYYYRQENYEKALELYAELAEAAVSSFLVSKDHPLFELARIYEGKEENKELLRSLRGEEDEGFQVIEHQATRGDPKAMYEMGIFYYFGLRGLKPDVAKAMLWFMRAAVKREPRAMEMLGEMYTRDVGFGKNYSQAFDWFSLAAQEKHLSAYNGLGYLYVRGYGVKERNVTKARLCFEKAAKNRIAGGHYNLGVLYLNGLGVKRSFTKAIKYLVPAANAGHSKALFQVANLVKKGIGIPQKLGAATPQNLFQATSYYKKIAEKGPWISMFRLAMESYNKGDVGKALLLYLRMAELGYEVAQSNAAWILDKYGENSMCVGEFGACTDRERHFHVHSLWWQASEQGNEHAALLIGDAYYYGRGTERNYELAAEAYMLARSALPKPNAQAMFNLGYMYEHGKGLPFDLHLAKRYYDQALESDPAAKLPVTFALASLWLRKNYADSFMVDFIDSLPEVFPRVQYWVTEIVTGEGNATIMALFVCLLTVIYLRERQRRRAVIAFPPDPHPHPPEERFN